MLSAKEIPVFTEMTWRSASNCISRALQADASGAKLQLISSYEIIARIFFCNVTVIYIYAFTGHFRLPAGG
jgi:hypothetical protein